VAPSAHISAAIKFVIADEGPIDKSLSPVKLVKGPQLAWMPTILRSANVLMAADAQLATVLAISAALGGLVLARPIDEKSFLPVTIFVPARGAVHRRHRLFRADLGAAGNDLRRCGRLLRAGPTIRS